MTSDLLNVVVTDAGTLKFPPKLFGKLHSTWESGQCGPGRARWAVASAACRRLGGPGRLPHQASSSRHSLRREE